MSKTRSQSVEAGGFDDIRKILKEIQTSLEKKATKEQIDCLLAKINEKEERISKLENEVANIKKSLEVITSKNVILTKTVELIERKSDDHESYLRRQCLRITGIPEDANEDGEASLKKVKKEVKKLGLDINDSDYDRAHRIGKVVEGKCRMMIVKFTTWRVRTYVYKKRKKSGKTRFYLDLTRRRFNLLKESQELTDQNDKVDFVFSDNNNNICLRLVNGRVKIFNSVIELQTILTDLEEDNES